MTPRNAQSKCLTLRTRTARGTGILLALFALLQFGCGQPAQVIFQVKGVAPTQDGSFTNQQGWLVSPTEIRVVLGDIHLKREEPSQLLEVFSSLPPLIEPGTEVPAEEIGKFGRFPGMWAINVLQNAQIHSFPAGNVEVANWNQLQLRMSPAVSGVRGISAGDAILGYTALIAGQIRKEQAICNIRIKAAIDLGMATRIQFTTQSTLIHRNIIEVKYSEWLRDVNFNVLCAVGVTNTIEIDKGSHPQVIETIRNALPSSLQIQFGAGAAQ